MDVARLRALIPEVYPFAGLFYDSVEMDVARLRALTPYILCLLVSYHHRCRNGCSPFKGIDTLPPV